MKKMLWLLGLLGGGVHAQCDSIDFNRDGLFPDTQDQDDFISVFSGGPCSTGDCNDIDFNNDGIYPDTADVDAFLRVFSGGQCRVADAEWSQLPPLPDGARVVYLSGSGSESNSGDDAQHPLRRWATAWAKVRNGFGDRICIVGDLALDEVNGASMYHKSGASEYAPIIVYGETLDGHRPVVTRVGPGAAFYLGGSVVEYVWFLNLDVRGDGAAYGLQSYVTGGGWLIEGCSFTGFSTGVNLNGNVDGVNFRRTVFADNASATSHSQGVYIEGVRNITFDECVWDNNGRINGAGTIFNHNLYVNATCSGVTVKNSITARASATGLQLRWNRQDAIGNLVIDCPLGITLGHDSKLSAYPGEYVTGSVMGNFIVGTADISPLEPRRGPGIGFGLARNVTISGNYMIDAPNAAYGAIRSDRPSTHVNVVGNYSNWPTPIMQWGGTANSAEPTNMVDVDQEPRAVKGIEDYMRSFKIVPPTKARFIELAKQNRNGAWDERWTAAAYIEWAKSQ